MIHYKVLKSRRTKNLRITVKQNGECVVSAPKWVSENTIKRFVESKLDWVLKALRNFRNKGFLQGVKTQTKRQKRAEYLSLKEKARALVLTKLEFFNQYYNFKYNKVAIRAQSTRWGSCSGKANLNFNFKVVRLPENLLDYIVVHELCHLKEFNHSKDFWNLVGETIPDFKNRVKELKKIMV